MLIFGYTDYEDDRLQVETRGSEDFLTFYIPEDQTNHMEGRGVHVPRDEALRLYSAMGEWLYPVHTPEGPNRSLIEELIAKAVKDQVAAILPLHLKTAPVAEHRPQECPGRPECPEGEPEQCRGEYGCATLGVHAAYGSACGRLGDPEPRDVGHVEEPAKPYQRPFHMTSKADCKVPGCTSDHMSGIHGRQDSDEAPRPCAAPLPSDQPLAQVHEECGFLWVLHKVAGTDGPESKFGRPLSPEAQGRLMKELLPQRTRPRTAPKCLDCLHGWGEHTGGICWGMTPMQERDGEAGCRCTRERPGTAGTDVPACTRKGCGHPISDHNSTGSGCNLWLCPCEGYERPGTAGTVLCTCPRYATHPHGPDGCMHPSCTCKQKRQVRS